MPCMELLTICQNLAVNENLQWRKSFVILPIDGTLVRAFRGVNIDYPLTSAPAPINSRTTSSRPALAIHRIRVNYNR